MPLLPFSLPSPLGAGEGAISLLTTNGYISYVGDGSGALVVGPSSGEITRWHSAPLADRYGPGKLTWDTLQSLPMSQSFVTKIYAAALLNFNAALGFQYLQKHPGISQFIQNGTAAASGQKVLLLASGSGAQTFDLSSLSFELYNDSTLSRTLAPPGEVMQVTAIGAILYYQVTAIPIGHASNCNAYGPIGLADGATSAPGNGSLITV